MHVEVHPCAPAAAAPIESSIKFCYILSMGAAAAAGADRGTIRLGFEDLKILTFEHFNILKFKHLDV